MHVVVRVADLFLSESYSDGLVQNGMILLDQCRTLGTRTQAVGGQEGGEWVVSGF